MNIHTYIPIHTISKEIDNMIIYNSDKAESEAIADLLLDILIDIFLKTTEEEVIDNGN